MCRQPPSATVGSPSGGWRSSWPAWAWWPTRPTCSRSASGTRTWWPGWPSSGPAAGSSVPAERTWAGTARGAPDAGQRHAGVASAMILFGLAAIVSFGLYQTQPPGAAVQSLSGEGTITVQNLATGLEVSGLGLLVLGAIIFRFARRLSSADARRLMLRDPRPPVLYLRSFGDDRLRLWRPRSAGPRWSSASRCAGPTGSRRCWSGTCPGTAPSSRSTRRAPGWPRSGPRGRPSIRPTGSRSWLAGWLSPP